MNTITDPNIDSALLNAGNDLSIVEVLINRLSSRPAVSKAVKGAPEWIAECLLIDRDDIEALARMLYLLMDDVEEIRLAHRAEEVAHG